ncbi:hypothetical protein RHMOL_Rhmol13G0057500 [Rhododendron molle]|uniref:Uncharacterized protein n=1 Tax=Rhododendron molle TaxID=49168 RepID=A0ACC0L4B8_RHOML|nr:hypothetical protein RHMOL_Rhmol13G0057500 [Rhododendron molle]
MVDNIPGLSPFRLSDLPSFFHVLNQQSLQRLFEVISKVLQAQYLLFNSVFELEPSVIHALQATFSFPVYSLGPLIPYFNLQYHNCSCPTTPNGVDYLEWLDSQPQSSVLYISLGSFLSVSSAQMNEIAAGLHSSGVKYLWVVRDKVSSVKESVCGGLGMVVPWCDQLKVKDANGDLVRREEITELVRRFMDSENVGRKEMVERVREIRETCLRAIEKGRSSEKNFEAFMKDISE